MSGWFGDTTDVADTTPSIGNDDYKADLDAVNIVSLMKKIIVTLLQRVIVTMIN